MLAPGSTALVQEQHDYRNQSNRIFSTIASSAGDPLYRIVMELPPSSIQRGRFPVSLMTASGFVVLVFAVILLLLDRQVLQPLARVVRHLQRIRSNGATDVAARIHAALAEAAIAHPDSKTASSVTVSIGVAVIDPALEHDLSAEHLVARADKALYAAKGRGRNCTVVFGEI